MMPIRAEIPPRTGPMMEVALIDALSSADTAQNSPPQPSLHTQLPSAWAAPASEQVMASVYLHERPEMTVRSLQIHVPSA